MKYLYCYLGKFIEWETDKDRSLETYRYCDLTFLVKGISITNQISEVSLLSPIGDYRPGEMFLTDENLFNSWQPLRPMPYEHTTYNLDFSEYGGILNGLEFYYGDVVFKSTGTFDKYQTSKECLKVLDEYVKEKTRDLKIDLILD